MVRLSVLVLLGLLGCSTSSVGSTPGSDAAAGAAAGGASGASTGGGGGASGGGASSGGASSGGASSGGAGADAGPGAGVPVGSIDCGGTSCDVTTSACCYSGGTGVCQGLNEPCDDKVSIRCASPQNCAAGLCCYQHIPGTSTVVVDCRITCVGGPQTAQVCDASKDECPTNTDCQATLLPALPSGFFTCY